MSILIEARDIEKRYVVGKAELRVLRGASLEVRAGESLAIVGKSGAGKSTLLHIIGGLDIPDAGRVALEGQSLYAPQRGGRGWRMQQALIFPFTMGLRRLASAEDVPTNYFEYGSARTRIRATKVGFVFQAYHLFPEMDVLENVMLPGMARGSLLRNWKSLRQRAGRLLEDVGLADRSLHTPLELSGGEQQRVALARALVNEPKIVLADEPTGNLDDVTGGQVLDLLFRLTKEQNHSLVVVTHNERIARTCDRMLRLDDGVLAEA